MSAEPAAAVAPRRLAELAAAVGGGVRGDGERPVRAVRPLTDAGPEDLAPLLHAKFRATAQDSRAGVLLVPRRHQALTEGLDADLLLADDPQLALIRLVALLHPEAAPRPGVHPTAVIGEGCSIDPTAHVGPCAVIGDGSRVGPRVVIGALAVVGRGCRVGEETRLHPHSVLYDHTVLGARCIVHAGAVVGGDGYGYVTRDGVHHKRPHAGRAVLGDDVEVGVNSAVDRGALGDTVIGAGSKIDNLVQIAHNVRTGRGVLLAGQVGIAGSTLLGDHVVFGGGAGAIDHLTVGDGVQVAARAAVFNDLEADTRVGGLPAMDLGAWRRQTVVARRLEEMWRRLRALERAVEQHGEASEHSEETEETEETQ